MKSTFQDVVSYLQRVPEDRLEALNKLRNLCLGTLQGYQECMDYGVPCYKRNGIVEVAFASQKNCISLYILKQDVVSTNKDLLKGLKMGKACIRYNKPAKIDFGIVKQLLIGTHKSKRRVC